MEYLIYILAIGAGGTFLWRYVDSKRIEAKQKKAAKKLEFTQVRHERASIHDPFVKIPFYEGEVDGVRSRIITLQICPADEFTGRQRPPTDEQSKQWVTALSLELDVPDIYLMSRQRMSPGEAELVEKDSDFVEVDTPLQSSYTVLGSSEFPPRFLESSEVASLLTELARTYQVVRIFKGWLTVANDSFDPDLVDVDLEHLTEARKRILEATLGRH